jgi:L-alanine-DL-glutamate epimerase-like enolase superfamily enzyme
MLLIADAQVELWRYYRGHVPGRADTMDLLVTNLTASDGQTGMGFTHIIDGHDDLPLRAARSQLERFVVGKALQHPIALWRQINASMVRSGRGPYFSALAAIDVAAWDLYAKSLGVPVGIAMGGAPRRVPVYGSDGFTPGMDPDEAADHAQEIMRAGLRGVKPRAACTPHDRKVLHAIAGRIGGKINLMVDANRRGSLSTAKRLLHLAAEVGALWVEEPLPVIQHSGYETLARTAPVRIATGENLRGSDACAPYVINRWCGIIQPDLATMGGLTDCLHLAQLAEHCNVDVAPHFLPGIFIQLAMAAPNLAWLEELPTIEPLFTAMPVPDADGFMTSPTTHGHGLAFSEDARAEWRIA